MPVTKEMPKEDAKRVMASSEFQDFLVSSSRYIERALGAEFDVRGDFFVDDEESEDEEGGGSGERAASRRNKKVGKAVTKFTFDEATEYHRTVTSIDWNPHVPELLLASYSESQTWGLDEPDGLINIYSIAMQTRPELSLTCQYNVTKAIFNPFDPNIVIGATQTGYLLEWDVRAKKDPVRGVERRDVS